MAFQRDMLENKKRELELFTQQFDDAVSVVTGSIARLEAISEQTQKKLRKSRNTRLVYRKQRTGLPRQTIRMPGSFRTSRASSASNQEG